MSWNVGGLSHLGALNDKECRELKKTTNYSLSSPKKGKWKKEKREKYLNDRALYDKLKKQKEKDYYQGICDTLEKIIDATSFFRAIKRIRRPTYRPNPISSNEWEQFYESFYDSIAPPLSQDSPI